MALRPDSRSCLRLPAHDTASAISLGKARDLPNRIASLGHKLINA
jgi:hypothetical protein